MLAHGAEEVDDLAVDVVEDFRLGPRRFAQQDTAHAGEGLGVAGMGDCLDALDDAPGEVLLAAEPGRERLGGCGGRGVRRLGVIRHWA